MNGEMEVQDTRGVEDRQPTLKRPDEAIAAMQNQASVLSDTFDRLKVDLLREIEGLLTTFSQSQLDETGRPNMGRDYVQEISRNNACQHYLQYLVELKGLVKSAEKSVRVSQRSMKLEQGPVHIEYVSQAVDLIKQCMSYMHAMGEIEERVEGVALKQLSSGIYSRAREAGKTARIVISSSMQKCLKDSNWPPPLLPSAQKSTQLWNGFEEAGDEVFREIQQLIVLMISLQMAVEYQSFSQLSLKRAEQIVLWPAVEFSSAINSWIASHFSPSMPTCSIEKPEWLFSAVHHAVKICSGHVDIFEPCIEALGIQHFFSFGVEVAKSVYVEGLYKVIKGVYLPLIFEENDAPFVLHYVDEAIKFESKYRRLRVDPLIDSDIDTHSHYRSMIEIIFENGEWASQWMKYEGDEARQRIQNITCEPQAWKPNTTTPDHLASLCEFYPSCMVSNAIEVLIDLLDRAKYIHGGNNKLLWCQTVVKTAIDALTSYMQSELIRTEQFEHLIDDIGMPIMSGCLNGLHYLEHMMTEPTGILLDAFISSPEIDAFLENQSNTLSIMRRKWTNKVVSMSMKSIFSSFLHMQLMEDEPLVEQHGPSPHIVKLRNEISALLNEFSKYVDQVIFREVWKGIALSTSESFLENIQSSKQSTDGSLDSLKANLDILVSAFSSFSKKPEAYFRACFDAF